MDSINSDKVHSSLLVQDHNLTSHLQYFALYVVQTTDNTYILRWIDLRVFLIVASSNALDDDISSYHPHWTSKLIHDLNDGFGRLLFYRESHLFSIYL